MAVTSRQAAAVLDRLAPLYPHHPLHVDPALPFQVLVATVLSARTQDPTTNAAMARLWPRLGQVALAAVPAEDRRTRRSTPPGLVGPADLLTVPEEELAALLRPVGFYLTKARHLRELAQQLQDDFGGQVPRTREELLRLSGVGRKVANLVLNICFDEPAICVDIHVHRITNRLGWVQTDTPDATERALEVLVPRRLWSTLNRVLVNHGQQVCRPASPRCSACVIYALCARIGVERSR
jgi:endonuclease-3